MKAGIIGLPSTGKTTVFKMLTHGKAAAGMAPGRKQEPSVGIALVPDARLDHLASVYKPNKTTRATIEFVDIQGLIWGKGQELVLAPLRTVDALVHVLREFKDPSVPHPEGSVDPERDRRHLEHELMLADLALIEKRAERVGKDLKKVKDSTLDKELAYLARAKAWLESDKPLREMEVTDEEKRLVKGFALLSEKPVVYVENIGEDQIDRLRQQQREAPLRSETAATIVCGKLEAEMAQLAPEEIETFLAGYALTESGAERLIRTTYWLLKLISFFTVGATECRAWTVKRGTSALGAAGAIHTDIAAHFIRAEVCHYDEFVKYGSMQALKEKGMLRLEGKEYLVKDGDIMTIRHSG